MDMSVNWEGRLAQREEQDDGRRLGPHALEPHQPGFRLFHGHLAQEIETQFAAFGQDGAQCFLDARSLRLCQAAGTDGLDQLVRGCSHDLPPVSSTKPLLQPLPGPIPVDIVRVLREDRDHELAQGVETRAPGTVAIVADQQTVDCQGSRSEVIHDG